MFRRIAGVLEEVGAFVGFKLVEGVGDGPPEVVDGSGGGLSQEGLELGEGLFDWIEVGGIGWQVEQEGAGHFDGFAHAVDLVAG